MTKHRLTKHQLVWLAIVAVGCTVGERPSPSAHALTPDAAEAVVHGSVQALTDVLVHDIFSPPLASRAYAYPLVAFYEAARHAEPGFRSAAGQLSDLPPVPAPDGVAGHGPSLVAGVRAFDRVATAMVFSEDLLRERLAPVWADLEALGVPSAEWDRALAYGDAVANHVLAWAGRDGYREMRTLPRYAVAPQDEAPGAWQPTPPAYLEPIEPHWNRLRPFVLERADQFAVEPPPAFSLGPESRFYRDLVEVYEVGRNLSDEERAIAAFWDCNPFVVHSQGHLAYGLKKISPGAHWIGITGIVTEQAGASPTGTLATYVHVAVALADAFIASWDEKYRSNLVRPETVIRAHLDPTWQPALQTPPFPEYTSGHSVISTAAAAVLTHHLGEGFRFIDSTEVAYGLPPRTFESFHAAAAEAAISRLYGGIHYRPAIENGVEQGRQVGQWAIRRLALRPAGAPAVAVAE